MSELGKLAVNITADASEYHATIDKTVSDAKSKQGQLDVNGKATLDTSGMEGSAREAKRAVDGLKTASKEAFEGVEADSRKASQSVHKDWDDKAGFFQKQFREIGDSVKQIFTFSAGQLTADAIRGGMRVLKDVAKESISLASDLQEVQNVVDVTFGDDAGRIESWAQNAREQFGMTELQAKQYSSTMGAMFKSMGVAEDDVYSMSTAMAGLAADMASFYNLDFDTAFQKIRAGISGETEPLKQLGVNMSVANLEAFALAQGITKSYEAMNQAEQATLRYNYLMQATADAQGDFARTSDSYANSLRVLKTNWKALEANLGQLFLPVITDAIVGLNSLFDSQRNLSEQFADADKSFEQNASGIMMNDARAQALLNTLDSLAAKESLTVQETRLWNATVSELTGIYPSLQSMIGTTAGKYEASAEAIRGETQALMDNALEKAKAAALQTKLDAWATTAVKAAEAEAEANAAYGALMASETKLRSEIDEKLVQAGMSEERRASIIQAVLDGAAINNATLGFGDRAAGLTSEELTELRAYQKAFLDANASAVALYETRDDLNAQLAEQRTETEKTAKSLEGFGFTVTETAEGMNAVANNGKTAADNFTGFTDVTADFTASLEEMKKRGLEVNALFADLEKYKLDNFNQVRKNIEGTFGTFDRVDRVKRFNRKSGEKNIDAQIERNQEFQDLMAAAKEAGASEQVMAMFAEGGISGENIGMMREYVKAGSDGMAQLNELMATLATEQSQSAALASDSILATDEQYQTMMDNAKANRAQLEADFAAIQANATNLQGVLQEKGQEAQEQITEVQEVGDLLGMSTWEPTIDADDKASGVISAVDHALERLDGKKIKVVIDVEQNGSIPGPPLATGMDYVPYDDFGARLHEGEAVLTREEAANWRKGAKSRDQEPVQPIEVNVYVQGQTSDAYEIADGVKNALELLRWQG